MKKILVLCGGSFAFPSIQLLAQEQYIAGVVLASNQADIKKEIAGALSHNNIPFLFIPSVKELQNIEAFIKKTNAAALFSICFPYLLPTYLLNILPNRCINFHTGQLPHYRGAMPIFETLRSFEKETALSVHIMSEAFDEGNIILQEIIEIEPHETFGSLAHKFSQCTELVALNLARMLDFGSQLPSTLQHEQDARYYAKPTKKDTIIQWQQMHAEEIQALVNACNPWNIGADTMLENIPIKLIEVYVKNTVHGALPGSILQYDKQLGIEVACIEDQSLVITVLHSDKGIISADKFVGYKSLVGKSFKT